VTEAEPVLLVCEAGTGKTHVSIALAGFGAGKELWRRCP
jgi:hypothetical protein